MLTSLQDPKQFRELGEALAAATQAVAAQYGVTVTYAGGTLGERQGMVRLKLDLVTADGLSQEALDFQRRAPLYRLQPDDLGREFLYAGHAYRVVGLSITSRRTPILVERLANGKTYKIAADAARLALAEAPK